ncbi:hypothetical protein [Flavobacterium sangjuense]|uniref:Lipoprotein n=1 Tax=Flavobacterium sangjuense TaxID=2518177 RepID=A0A4V1CBY2_9FLAO|nr:hypothetical protein [Flavobacterium sangjuense]QBZ97574.1 hypothetical protein GS03_01066 [Flavobacterium sangjuense]
MKLLKLTLLIILFASCERKISDLEFEKNVMTEILPSLIDSTCIDRRIMLNFPPKYGESIYDKEGHYIGVDSTKATQEEKENLLKWEKKNLEIEKDTSKIIVAFKSKIEFEKEDVESYFESHFKGAKIYKTKPEENPEYILDFQKIKLESKFKLKDISEFPKTDKIWDTKYNFNFSGVVYFSKIQFDKDKKFGILNGGFWCGNKCGQGFRIYIRKDKNKWQIDKVEGTWIS